jgi:hypothetical protein
MDHSERMGVSLRHSPHGFIFDSRRKGGCPCFPLSPDSAALRLELRASPLARGIRLPPFGSRVRATLTNRSLKDIGGRPMTTLKEVRARFARDEGLPFAYIADREANPLHLALDASRVGAAGRFKTSSTARSSASPRTSLNRMIPSPSST